MDTRTETTMPTITCSAPVDEDIASVAKNLRRELLGTPGVQRATVGYDDESFIVMICGGNPCTAVKTAGAHKPPGLRLTFTYQEP